jgi:hypothetical protein
MSRPGFEPRPPTPQVVHSTKELFEQFINCLYTSTQHITLLLPIQNLCACVNLHMDLDLSRIALASRSFLNNQALAILRFESRRGHHL